MNEDAPLRAQGAVLAILVLLLLLQGCVPHIIRNPQIRNTTAKRVHIYFDKNESWSTILEPGQTHTNQWLVFPEVNSKHKVEARTVDRDELVFCRVYTFDQLEAAAWQIDITDQPTPCRQGVKLGRFTDPKEPSQ